MTYLGTYDLKLDRLRTYPGNARVGNVEVIKDSLVTNDQYRAIIVRADDPKTPEGGGTVLAGNHTFQAAGELGWSTIRVECHDVDDEQAARINLVDNKASDESEWDDAALAALLAEVPDLSGTGFTQDDLDDLNAALEETDDLTEGYADTHAGRALATAGNADSPDGGDGPGGSGEFNAGDEVTLRDSDNLYSRADAYANRDVRPVILQYSGDTYVWVVETLAELSERYDVESNSEVVLRLLQKETANAGGEA